MAKISVAGPKAEHGHAAADAGRRILLTALYAVWLSQPELACPAVAQAMPRHHGSVRRLIEPVTDILKGPARPRSPRRPDLRRHGHPEGEHS